MAKDKAPSPAPKSPLEQLFPSHFKKIDPSKLRLVCYSIGDVYYANCQATGIGGSIRNASPAVKSFLKEQNTATNKWLEDRNKRSKENA